MVASRMVIVLAAAATAMGCSRFPTAERDAVREVRIIAGDSQTVRVNAVIPRPVEIEVLDANGRPVRYSPLFWEMQMADGTDAGSIVAAIAETDLDGQAEALAQVGEQAGEYVLRVTAGRYEQAPGDTVIVRAEAIIFAVEDAPASVKQ